MRIAGFDISSFAVDIVLLDENSDQAEWHRIALDGATPFDRARALRLLFPGRSFWEDAGVYLAGFEDPYSRQSHTAKALGLVTGAAATLLPSQLPTVQTAPAEWKRIFTGNPNASKHDVWDRCMELFPPQRDEANAFAWAGNNNASDAYGIAWAVRALNNEAIQRGRAA